MRAQITRMHLRRGSLVDRAIAVAIISGATGMVGVYLDTAWHRTIGSDSLLMVPHLFIYGGGLGILAASLASVARATLGHAKEFGGPILRVGRLRCPLGFRGGGLGGYTVLKVIAHGS